MLNNPGLPCPQLLLELEVDTAEAAVAALWRQLLPGAPPARLPEGRGGIGEGVALPHARLAGLSAPLAGFARLARPVAFDALDGRGCDLIYLLLSPLAPQDAHLKALARAARFFRREHVRQRLRAAAGPEALAGVFTEPAAQAA